MKDMKEMIVQNYQIVDVLMDIVLLVHLIIVNVNVILVGMEFFVMSLFLISHQTQIQFLVDFRLKL